jgi:hypothetical protein
LDGVVFWEIFRATVADDFANAAMSGYPEIVLGDGNFKFRQHIVVGLVSFYLIIGYELTRWLCRTACN